MSVNCQGLGDIGKRRDIFDYLRDKNCNIYCLEDTHFTPSQENDIENLWGYKCYFSSFSSNSRGVAIFFKNNFEFQVHRERRDLYGNYLALDVTIENHKITLIAIYGPNMDDPGFYEKISDIIEDFENQYFVICGDFNLVLNPEIDYYNYLHVNNPKARLKLLEIIDNQSMVDPYRELYPDKRRYTWRKKSPLKQSRLDFFLISDVLLPSLKDSYIESSYRSDHSIIVLHLVFNDFKRGKGLWKFNNSLLSDQEYLDTINVKIEDIKNQYSAIPLSEKQNIMNSDFLLSIDDQLFLETLLMEIRGKTIAFSSYKKRKERDKEENLTKEIQRAEENINSNTDFQSLEEKKQELKDIRGKKLRGSVLRSKAIWISEGKKPSKYFCNLESRNFTNRIIPKVQKDDEEMINNQKDILKEIKFFYQELYSKKKIVTNKIKKFLINTMLTN